MKTAINLAALAAGLAIIGTAGAKAAPATGSALFAENCAACHQPMGQGIKGAFPALAGNVFIKNDPALVAATVLNGRGGMPSFKSDLNDTEIATVLTFVRASWGNHLGKISAADVAAARSAKTAEGPRKIMQAH